MSRVGEGPLPDSDLRAEPRSRRAIHTHRSGDVQTYPSKGGGGAVEGGGGGGLWRGPPPPPEETLSC